VISEYGVTKLFTELSLHIGKVRGLLGKSAHVDTTTLSLYGDYDYDSSMEEDVFPWPMQGYAKSGRHDLKQMVLLLATTGASSFPLWMEAHSGNASDQVTLPKAAVKMQAFCKNLEGADEFIYVGDSAMYANILAESERLKWVSRVPERLLEAKHWVSESSETLSWIQLENGYAYCAKTISYKGVIQRWLLFYSESAYLRESSTLDKKIHREHEEQTKLWWHLSNRIFTCQQDAHDEASKQQKRLKHHCVEFSVVDVKKHAGRGRPKQGELPERTGYRIEYQLKPNHEIIAQIRSCKGRFILATNQLDEMALPNHEVLREYKAQSGVERGFKFIKDDTFQVDSVFLKTPARIEALMMVMTLCLMVYGVSEYELQQSMKASGSTIRNQVNKPTNKPSLKWVFFLFRVATQLCVTTENHTKKIVTNINHELRNILQHFGPRAKAIYLNPA
jgi:transposase